MHARECNLYGGTELVREKHAHARDEKSHLHKQEPLTITVKWLTAKVNSCLSTIFGIHKTDFVGRVFALQKL